MANLVEARIRAAMPAAQLILVDPGSPISEEVRGATDIWFLSSDLIEAMKYDRDFATQCDRMAETAPLRWVQSGSSGHERAIFRRITDRGAQLTSGAGIHSVPIAHYVLSHMLARVKRHRDHASQQTARIWAQLDQGELTGMTVGIAGFGSIGAEVARLCKAFGMHVRVCRREAVLPSDADAVHAPAELDDMARQCDFLVIAVPLTAQTAGMVTSAVLRAMKPGAGLINVARGPVVDEPALVAGLRAGSPAFAILDVATVEPLPEESPLWGMPNVTITPHDSAWSPLAYQRLGDLFCDNLARFAAGKPMRNIVHM
ncbi:D-2-hydroxyacid dehydrogenase [Sphingomonas oligophenolica]|uniref:D-2-hydroxyacid dehydrogenase n=2 Tax=Sphingomonas oligophenolica TaxID=301154 RepID=A0ABU9Y9G8_9SPHN